MPPIQCEFLSLARMRTKHTEAIMNDLGIWLVHLTIPPFPLSDLSPSTAVPSLRILKPVRQCKAHEMSGNTFSESLGASSSLSCGNYELVRGAQEPGHWDKHTKIIIEIAQNSPYPGANKMTCSSTWYLKVLKLYSRTEVKFFEIPNTSGFHSTITNLKSFASCAASWPNLQRIRCSREKPGKGCEGWFA
jgi:hypothetical protein